MQKKGISLWLCSLLMLMTAVIGGFFAIGFYEVIAADEEKNSQIITEQPALESSTISQVAS